MRSCIPAATAATASEVGGDVRRSVLAAAPPPAGPVVSIVAGSGVDGMGAFGRMSATASTRGSRSGRARPRPAVGVRCRRAPRAPTREWRSTPRGRRGVSRRGRRERMASRGLNGNSGDARDRGPSGHDAGALMRACQTAMLTRRGRGHLRPRPRAASTCRSALPRGAARICRGVTRPSSARHENRFLPPNSGFATSAASCPGFRARGTRRARSAPVTGSCKPNDLQADAARRS